MNEQTVEINDENIVRCSKCKSEAFTEILTFAKIPAIVSQSGRAGIAPIGSTYICMNCGTDISETDAVRELQENNGSGLIL